MAADIDSLYNSYKQTPSPDSLHAVVQAMEPTTINYALASVNAHNDPVVRSKAMLVAADAVEKFDPKMGASLSTYVSSQLRQLSRTARQNRSPVAIPDRVQVDAYKLDQAKKRFTDQHGREPDVLELADFTKMPVKRIEKIHRFQFSMPSEETLGADFTEQMPDFDREALEYVYHSADHTDRRILEMKTGYGGYPVMEPKDIALKLKLTPSQLSRRSMRLTAKLNELKSSLEAL